MDLLKFRLYIDLVIRDLQTNSGGIAFRRPAVVVIGAGIAGLVLATSLSRRGVKVCVLESGGKRDALRYTDPLNSVEQVGQNYRGATQGRTRGLGGTSQLWGGAMLPFVPCDMGTHTAGWPVDWDVCLADLEPAFAEIERTFGLPGGAYETSASGNTANTTFLTRSAKWPTFKMRNVADVFDRDIQNRSIEIWLNATVTSFALTGSGRITRLTAQSMNGNRLDVESDIFVVAAGAIESTRLLLLMDTQHNEKVFAPDQQLGKTFFDHLSTSAATIKAKDQAQMNRAFGFRFERGGMRDQRIEPSPALRQKHQLPAAFAHVAAISEQPSGFNALREAYRGIQSHSGISLVQLRNIARDIPWLAQAVYWKFCHQRLLFPRDAKLELILVTEQKPNPLSTITLSKTSCDRYGVPRARIDWRTTDADIEAFSALQSHLCAFWENSRFASIGSIIPTTREHWETQLQSDSDVFHPGGTTRMGRTASTGVVDKDLRAFRVPNLTVVSTSCYPSGGGSNPTFMLMAFALRAADRIFKEIRRS